MKNVQRNLNNDIISFLKLIQAIEEEYCSANLNPDDLYNKIESLILNNRYLIPLLDDSDLTVLETMLIEIAIKADRYIEVFQVLGNFKLLESNVSNYFMSSYYKAMRTIF